MKKTFPLQAPGKADARVVEAIKNDVRKYVKRERRKKLPEGFTLWDFACKVGATPDTAQPIALNDITGAIDAAATAAATHIYIEIIAAAGHRPPPPQAAVLPTP